MKLDRKIIQIIPTSQKIMAVYKDKDMLLREQVICFALVEENYSGEPVRYVVPMDFSHGETYVDFCDECSNFLGLEFDGKEKYWQQCKIT